MSGPVQYFAEEIHGARRMGDSHQTSLMNGGNQKSAGYPNGFGDIVVLDLYW